MRLLGIDGCKNGAWIAASPGPLFEIITDLESLIRKAELGSARLVADVPIGLDGAGRKCDSEARRLLKRRRSSVFTPPSRAALVATTQAEASRLNRQACGMGLGCQAFGILPRIAAVDQWITCELQSHVHEGHPEVTFATIAGSPARFNKKCGEGEQERLSALALFGLRFDPEAVRRELGRGMVARHDVIDAALMLVTAIRIEERTATRIPDCHQRDERGLSMSMWA